jgi:hypothetical protein
MRSILKVCYKFSPLFLGVVSLLLLGLALVPGRLEDADRLIFIVFALLLPSFQSFVANFPYWSIESSVLLVVGTTFAIPLIVMTIYDIRKIWHRSKNNLDLPPIPGLTSLFILACTSLLIQIHLPAQLWFYTSSDRFEQVLVSNQRQILNEGSYKGGKIGNFEILEIIFPFENNPSKSIQSKSIYFVTIQVELCFLSRVKCRDIENYGFAYLPSDRSRFSGEASTHIYGKWYIFHYHELPSV